MAQRDRFTLLADLWGAVAKPDLSVDRVLHSCREAHRRAEEPGSVVKEAFRYGVLLGPTVEEAIGTCAPPLSNRSPGC